MAGRTKEVNCHLLFRREFVLPGRPEGGALRIAASDQYRLYVNGRRIGDGPARSELPTAYVDSYDVKDLPLRKGANCIAVLAHSTMMPQHGSSMVPGGLWVEFDGRLAGGRRVRIGSDERWRVLEAPQFVKPAPRRFFAVGFNEKIHLAGVPAGWDEPGFDDGAWSRAARADDRFFHRLVERPIPMLRFEEWRPVRIRECGTVEPPARVWGLPFDRCENLPRHAKAVVFGTYVYSASEQTVFFSFGCDNSSRLQLNGRVFWEQGVAPPAAAGAGKSAASQVPSILAWRRPTFTPMKTEGMTHGNGHRMEPGSSRNAAGLAKQKITLPKGWSRLTIWIWKPAVAYGFELCFLRTKDYVPADVVCSAVQQKHLTLQNTWAILADEAGAMDRGEIVRTRERDVRSLLEPSRLWDWDVRMPSRKPHEGATSLLAGVRGPGRLTLSEGQYIEFDQPADGVGFLDLELEGPRGTLVDAIISEAQTPAGRVRSLYNGLQQNDRLILSGRRDRWLTLDRRAGWYIGLVVRRGGPVRVRKFALLSQHYPTPRLGRFECSDETFNLMWSKGQRTVDAATFDLAEDCPTREKAQWSGDTYMRMHETAYLWGDVRLSAKGIREFAEDQKPDRWSRAMVPCGYGDCLVEYSMILPMWIWEHYVYSGDAGVVRDSFAGVRNLLGLVKRLADRRGFAQPGPGHEKDIYIDYSMPPVTRCGDTIGMFQAAYVLALENGARLAEVLGEKDLAEEWIARGEKVRNLIRKEFWVEKESLFVDGLRRGKPGGTFSAPTNYWMLLAGIPDQTQEDAILRRLWKSPDRENLAMWERGESPYTKFFLSEALLSRGLWRQTFAEWRGYYGGMLRHREAWSAFEFWQRDWVKEPVIPRNSLVHPFAIGPMMHVMSRVAGVRPLRPGYDGVLWQPMPGDLKWIKAEVPLVARPEVVRVEMETLRGGGRVLVFHRPRGLEVQMSDKYLAPKDRMEVRD